MRRREDRCSVVDPVWRAFKFRCLFVSVMGCCILFTCLDASADRFWIEPNRPTSIESDWFPRGIEVRTGKVVQFDAKQFRYAPEEGGEEQSVAASRVIWVEPSDAGELEKEALDLFSAGQYSASLQKLPDILQSKPAIWRQQRITMIAAVAAWKGGRSEIALELVGQLDRRPLPPVATAWLPIAWTNRPSPSHAVNAAKARLRDPSAAVRLVAASWLLSTPDRSLALDALRGLEQEPRKEIARFARVLSWRTATPTEVAESNEKWRTAIDSLPMVWKTGPLTLLADKLTAANQREAAAQLRASLELTPIQPHYEWMAEDRGSP